MNRLYVSILLIGVILGSLSAKVTILEKSPTQLILEYEFDTPRVQYDRSRKGNIIVAEECGSAVQGKSGVILPAEMVNFAAASDAEVHVSVQAQEWSELSFKDLHKSEKSLYPEIQTGVLYTLPEIRKMQGTEIHSFLITPLRFNDGESKLHYARKLQVTIRFTAQRGSARSVAPELKKAVLNPEGLRMSSKRSSFQAARREGSYVKSSEKAILFSVDNGISTVTDQETNVEHTCNGIYSVSPEELLYLGSNIPVSQLRVRAANRMVYDSITPAPEKIPLSLQEVDVLVRDKNKDGLFNGSDELLFYGSALHFWYFRTFIDRIDTITEGVTVSYDTVYAGLWDFQFNDFDYKRYYWVTQDVGRSMEKAVLSSEPGVPKSAGLKLRRSKVSTNLTTPDDVYMGHASRDWKWQTVDEAIGTFVGTLETFNVSATDSVGVRLWIPKKRKSYNSDAYVIIGTDTADLLLDDGVSDWYYGPITAESFTFQATLKNGDDFYYDLSSFDTRYRRNLDMSGSGMLHFYSEEERGLATYTISNLPTAYTLILRVNEFENRTEIIDTVTAGGTYSFTDSSGIGYEYYLISEGTGSYKKISAAKSFPSYTYNASNSYVIRSITEHKNNNDYIIVTSPEFIAYADTLAGYKAAQGLQPVIFSTEDIYREFSGGVTDPTAIRNAMSFLRASNGELKYLLLFGGGHYDYKGYISREMNHILPYLDDDEILIEDFFGYLDPGEDATKTALSDLYIGRVPAKDITDAFLYLEKYKELEANSTAFGDWENRLVLMSDDDSQKGKIDPVRGHEVSSDFVNDEIVSKKRDLLIQELNLFEFPFGAGFTKPKAKETLFNYIKEGVLLINYFGHGAFHAITDEDIFLSSDLNSLINFNRGKYFIFSAFSCSVGFFDLPDRDAIASELLFVEGGGAIASISSTRTAYHDSNQKFGRAYYRELFDSTDAVRSLGSAYGIAKSFHNLNRYALLGDPAYAPYSARTSIGLTLKNKDGVPANSFKIFEDVYVEGTLPVAMASNSDNYLIVTLQNQPRLDEKRKDGGGPAGRDVTYDLPGELLYKSTPIQLTGNSFSHKINMPRSISQDTLGVSFKAYVYNSSSEVASGIVDTFTINGINLDGIDTTDKVGPQIRTRIAESGTGLVGEEIDFADAGSRIVIDGFDSTTYTHENGSSKVTDQVTIEFAISDSSGIDYFYNNAGEGITLEIKGIKTLVNLNDQFKAKDGSKVGTISYALKKEDVPGVGEYEMIITARDILGNVSREKYILDIRSMGEDQYDMGDFFCYPSPVYMGQTTRFWFNPKNSLVKKASLKIFTLDGRLIRHEKNVNSGFTWDLTDQKGNKLTPNIYMYRLYIERELRRDESAVNDGGTNTEVIKSPIRKLVIYPPAG